MLIWNVYETHDFQLSLDLKFSICNVWSVINIHHWIKCINKDGDYVEKGKIRSSFMQLVIAALQSLAVRENAIVIIMLTAFEPGT